MKILVVDDEKLARARMRELIEKEGEHAVVGEAMNGNEAIEKTMSLKPECLLMDIRMPVMDGLEAAMHLQSLDIAAGCDIHHGIRSACAGSF